MQLLVTMQLGISYTALQLLVLPTTSTCTERKLILTSITRFGDCLPLARNLTIFCQFIQGLLYIWQIIVEPTLAIFRLSGKFSLLRIVKNSAIHLNRL